MTYSQFRKEALLGSTPGLQEFYRLQLQRDRLLHEKTIFGLSSPAGNQEMPPSELVPGIKNEDLRDMFNTLSRGKGFIDIKTLYQITKESKIPVSEHQIMQFFYQCDINEDNKIDFIEFCHFMRSEEDAIRALFDQLDLDQTGYLTLDEIKRSFHIKYIKDHKGNLNEQLRSDMNKIDDWVNSVVANIKSTQNNEIETGETRITYEDFRTYATLSGVRNLLSMIQSSKNKNNQYSTDFIYDFDDIYLPQKRDESYSDVSLQFDKQRQRKLNAITFCSGTLAGIVSRTATAPIDRVKLFMQLKSHGSIGSHVHNIMQVKYQ